MGRLPGSKNKSKIVKTNSSVVRIQMDKQLEAAPVCKNSNRGWVSFGQKNNYPTQLAELYYSSPTHKAACDFAAGAILGDGVDYEKMQLKNIEEIMPNYQQTWEELIHSIALDYVVFGSYALQIIKNKDNKTYSIYHQPIADVRCSEKDEDGVITSYWISSDWTNIAKYPPIEVPAFNFQDDEKLAQGKPYLFVYQTYTIEMPYYQLPYYSAALKAIQAECEMIRYDLRSITNNFSASGILSLAGVDDDEQRDAIISNLEKTFQGSDNSNSLMIIFRDNGDDNTVQFSKFDKDVTNVNLFSENNNRTISRILSAHRIPSKQLIGYDADSAMLGGEGNLLNVAYNLYMKTVGSEHQRNVINTINKIFKLNGLGVEILLKPMTFNVLQPTTQVQDSTVDVEKEQYSSENIEEKVISEED